MPVIVEWPVVGRDKLEQVLKGSRGASASSIRRLAAEGILSPGATVQPRAMGRLSGRVSLHSPLALDALRAFLTGQQELARSIALVAARLEASAPFTALVAALDRLPREQVQAVIDDDSTERLRLVRELAPLRSALTLVAHALQDARTTALPAHVIHFGTRVRGLSGSGVFRVVLESGDTIPMLAATDAVGVGQLVDVSVMASDAGTTLSLRPGLEIDNVSSDQAAGDAERRSLRHEPLIRISSKQLADLQPSGRPRRRVPIQG